MKVRVCTRHLQRGLEAGILCGELLALSIALTAGDPTELGALA